MKIAFCYSDPESRFWLEGFRAALPEAQIQDWSAVETAPETLPDAGDAHYAIVWAPPQTFIDRNPQIKALFNIGAGVDALMKLRLPEQLPLVRLEDAGMAAQMAGYVCHYLLRHVGQFDRYEADQRAGIWSQREPRERADHPVGVMGLGVLGAHVAQAVRQFDFPVLGWSRSPRVEPLGRRPAASVPRGEQGNLGRPGVSLVEGVRCYHGMEQLKDFLAASRVLICLLPLTPDTQGILNQDSLSRLMPGGYLINVARGALVVDEDLTGLIDSGHLAGATLDVFRTEPLPPGHRFWKHPAITITPHTSARTLRRDSIEQIAGKIRAIERGEAVTGVVDPGRGY